MERGETKKTRYSRHGKIARPLSDLDFKTGMDKGTFAKSRHRGLPILLFYSAVRISEALRSLREQFDLTENIIYYDVGERLKKQRAWFKETDPLELPLTAPYMRELREIILETKQKRKVFPYCRKTGYNIISRVWRGYPHLFRASRITWFFANGWTIADVKSWTGLSVSAMEYYLSKVSIGKMGKSLGE